MKETSGPSTTDTSAVSEQLLDHTDMSRGAVGTLACYTLLSGPQLPARVLYTIKSPLCLTVRKETNKQKVNRKRRKGRRKEEGKQGERDRRKKRKEGDGLTSEGQSPQGSELERERAYFPLVSPPEGFTSGNRFLVLMPQFSYSPDGSLLNPSTNNSSSNISNNNGDASIELAPCLALV